MKINGRSLLSGSIVATECGGWLSGPAWQRDTIPLPNVAGVIPAPLVTGASRTMPLGLRVYPATLTDRVAALAEVADLLSGVLTVRTDDAPDRIIRAAAGPLTVTAVSPAMYASPWLEVQTTLTAYDGASYDAEPRVFVVGATATDVPLGTLPSLATVVWQGAWTSSTSRTLTLRDANGLVRTTVTFTAPASDSLGANDVLEIDLGRQYITKVTAAGTRTNAYSWRVSGAWPVLDPAYGSRVADRWPSLEVSAGTAVVLTRRAYVL